MLKFQNDYTTLFATFEDFILLVYTVIDDLYQQFAPACVSQRRNADSARMSDSEIITLSICGELLGMDSENAWYSFVKRNQKSPVTGNGTAPAEIDTVLPDTGQPLFCN